MLLAASSPSCLYKLWNRLNLAIRVSHSESQDFVHVESNRTSKWPKNDVDIYPRLPRNEPLLQATDSDRARHMCALCGASHCSELWVYKSEPGPALLRSWHVQSPLQGSVNLTLRSWSSTRTPHLLKPTHMHAPPFVLLFSYWKTCCGVTLFFFLLFFGKHCEDSHSLITSMQWERVVNSPSAKALISATSLNNLH